MSNILEMEFQSDGVSFVNWYVHDQVTGGVVAHEGELLPENPGAGWSFCLPDGCYYLVVTDDAGDGYINGGYVLRTVEPTIARIIDNHRNFSSGYTSSIANSEGFCLPLGEGRLILSSCDKLDWRTSPCVAEYMMASDNPEVTLQEGISDATSGYQAWWYDPNGGYSFKRFQSFLTANGLSPGPVRACHFKLNSWSGNQLQQQVLYNVRIRTRVNGEYRHWGPACRFMLDNAGAQCPRTKLIDNPGHPLHSCGQSRPISTTAFVHAQPARRMTSSCTYQYANRYQFRFRIPAESVIITKTSALGQYWVNTNGLTCGKTYEVDVRASFDGGGTWCHSSAPYGAVCLVSTTCGPAELASPDDASSLDIQSSRLMLYPNPNHGGDLRLRFTADEQRDGPVSIAIHDSRGRLVSTRTSAMAQGRMDVLLDLTGIVQAGIYMVSINTDDGTRTERLIVRP